MAWETQVAQNTNIYIDGEHAATITNLQTDAPWNYGTLIPGDAFEELKQSLDTAPWSTQREGAVELKAGEDTVDRVSWGPTVEESQMILQLTLAQYEPNGAWELEFTCEETDAEGAESGETAESAA